MATVEGFTWNGLNSYERRVHLLGLEIERLRYLEIYDVGEWMNDFEISQVLEQAFTNVIDRRIGDLTSERKKFLEENKNNISPNLQL